MIRYRIGLDFDNTVVSYDHLLQEEAIQRGWLEAAASSGKRAIRDRIRQRPQGEQKWRQLQAVVYSVRMREAVLSEGVDRFVARCRQQGAAVFVVSHKTEYAAGDATAHLRAAALAWMQAKGLFRAEGWGLSRGQVYFESTRQEKVQRIRALRCTHFIDDLEETFLEPTFPAQVARILYDPYGQATSASPVRIARTWEQVAAYVFDGV